MQPTNERAGVEATSQPNPVPTSPISPVIKWAGGKSQLIEVLTPLFPDHFQRYHEPFLGGGAVFFFLAPLHNAPSFLSDLNEELINFYRVLRDHTDAFLAEVRVLAEQYAHYDEERRKEMYYRWRNADRDPAFAHWSPLQRAVRFYFLNKTAYNGLYRTNRRGYFNVPWGRYKKPALYIPNALRQAAHVLRAYAQTLTVEPFERSLSRAQTGDFVYLDPPYVPLSETANFTAYTKNGFGPEDQQRLADMCRELDRRGVLFMLSNSDTPWVRDLYRGFHIQQVWARRSINANGAGRGPVAEVVVRNYT